VKLVQRVEGVSFTDPDSGARANIWWRADGYYVIEPPMHVDVPQAVWNAVWGDVATGVCVYGSLDEAVAAATGRLAVWVEAVAEEVALIARYTTRAASGVAPNG
jgi:hypothetical protein